MLGKRAGDPDEGDEHASKRRPQPLIQQQLRLVRIARLVDGAQLVDEQPAAGDPLVLGGELLDERPLSFREGVGPAAEDKAGALQPDGSVGILLAEPLPVLPSQCLERFARPLGRRGRDRCT
jgi:hypothetical protein